MVLFAGKTTEVFGAYLLPFAGIDELGGETVVHLLPTLGVDVGFGLLPDGDEVYHFVHATLIAEVHLVDEGAPALHLVVPRYVMEPEDKLFGAGLKRVVLGAVRLGILLGGTTAAG